jgi:hypothetical protein
MLNFSSRDVSRGLFSVARTFRKTCVRFREALGWLISVSATFREARVKFENVSGGLI